MQKTSFKVLPFKVTQELKKTKTKCGFRISPIVAAKANQCMTFCRVLACRWSPATTWTHHQQMEHHWRGCSEELQMEDAVNVLPRGHSVWPLHQLCYSASLQTSPEVFLCHLTSLLCRWHPCRRGRPLLHARGRESWSQEMTILIISGDNWRKEEEVTPTLMGSLI